MEKKSINLKEIQKKLGNNINDVVGIIISQIPRMIPSKIEEGKQTLVYDVHLYRKEDSKFLGKVEINLDDILS